MWQGAWGRKSHVDARWRLRRRAAFNGSLGHFGLVVSLLGNLVVFMCLNSSFMCVDDMLVDSS